MSSYLSFFFFKQKTAYEIRISDWSSEVCSSDLSDADVALHALTDAILGAIADGDIGTHFPPSDPQWRGAASDRFLADAVRRVRQRGGRIVHLDLTIICEHPKIGPHREAKIGRAHV